MTPGPAVTADRPRTGQRKRWHTVARSAGGKLGSCDGQGNHGDIPAAASPPHSPGPEGGRSTIAAAFRIVALKIEWSILSAVTFVLKMKGKP